MKGAVEYKLRQVKGMNAQVRYYQSLNGYQ